jgi:hypothetical protein
MLSFSESLGYLLISLLNIGIVLAWIILAVVCLFKLKKQKLNSVANALWTTIILLIPFLGAAAFLIMKPTDQNSISANKP